MDVSVSLVLGRASDAIVGVYGVCVLEVCSAVVGDCIDDVVVPEYFLLMVVEIRVAEQYFADLELVVHEVDGESVLELTLEESGGFVGLRRSFLVGRTKNAIAIVSHQPVRRWWVG